MGINLTLFRLVGLLRYRAKTMYNLREMEGRCQNDTPSTGIGLSLFLPKKDFIWREFSCWVRKLKGSNNHARLTRHLLLFQICLWLLKTPLSLGIKYDKKLFWVCGYGFEKVLINNKIQLCHQCIYKRYSKRNSQ